MRNRVWLVKTFARMGYAARGFIYLIVGAIALPAAFGIRGKADVDGALELIVKQEFGEPVLLVLAAGMVGYSAWRMVQAILDVDGHGWSPKGLCLRAAFVVTAILHLGIAFASLKLAFSIDEDNGSSSPARDLAAQIFGWPYGTWLVAGAGAIIAIAGLLHIYKGATGGFRKWFEADAWAMAWIDPISRFGLIARGVLFVVVGGLVAQAAMTIDPNQVVGLRGALQWLQSQAYGAWVLAAAGLGLIAFGAYSLIEAFVRRVGLSTGQP